MSCTATANAPTRTAGRIDALTSFTAMTAAMTPTTIGRRSAMTRLASSPSALLLWLFGGHLGEVARAEAHDLAVEGLVDPLVEVGHAFWVLQHCEFPL